MCHHEHPDSVGELSYPRPLALDDATERLNKDTNAAAQMHNYVCDTHAQDMSEAVTEGSERDTGLGLLSLGTTVSPN